MKLPELRIGKLVAKVPIIQGGMAIRLSTARLAAAVANEAVSALLRHLACLLTNCDMKLS